MTSRKARSRRSGLLVLALSAAVLAVGIAAMALSGGSDAGRLQPSSTTTVETPLAADEAGTWGVDLPRNPTRSDIIVKSVEPIDPQGLAILGMTMTNPLVAGGVVAVRGYPPPWLATFPIEGSVLSPSGGPSPQLQVLIGVQLAEGSKRGTIQGLRVRYAIDGREYEVVLPYSFSLVLPAS
ncbi:MAG TPA: hypothetical protein VLM76_14425 [Patescibacteria group bacterium]|nr:hypothetical protein [Patescibacteria group bacterium]